MTAAQKKLLHGIADGRIRYALCCYKPAQKLIELGLIHRPHDDNTVQLTESGKVKAIR